MFVFQTLGRSHGKGAILLKSLYLHYFLGELHGVSLRLASRRDGHAVPVARARLMSRFIPLL